MRGTNGKFTHYRAINSGPFKKIARTTPADRYFHFRRPCYFRGTRCPLNTLYRMLQLLSSARGPLGTACALLLAVGLSAQQNIWTDTYNGGLVVGSFSIGDQNSGIGMIECALPPGATIRKATLYAVAIGTSPDDAVNFTMGTIPIAFNSTTAGPTFSSTYGAVTLHTLDITAQLDPAIAMYTLDLWVGQTNFKEYMLVTEYELPGMPSITVDVFHTGLNAQLEENYTIHATHPMSTTEPIAFGTMAAYCGSWLYDYETVVVNGTTLGNIYGRDYNAGPGNMFGACATFHYAYGVFEGVGDDDPDQEVHGADALSNLAGLVADGAQNFQVTYRHSPTLLPAQQSDNIVNLIILAYSKAPCDNTGQLLGPDTLLCPGDTLLLDATRDGATYLWQNGSTAPLYTVTAPGTYIVQWSHPECTWPPDTIEVSMVQMPDPQLGGPYLLCQGDKLQIGHGLPQDVTAHWADGPTAVPRTVDTAGVYVLYLEKLGCSRTDSVAISLKDCSYAVGFPNVFTPNGDGENDVFKPLAWEGAVFRSFSIYNRWGQKVYSSSAEPVWNGRTANGQPVPDGVYFWVLEQVPAQAPDQPVATQGTVQVLR